MQLSNADKNKGYLAQKITLAEQLVSFRVFRTFFDINWLISTTFVAFIGLIKHSI